MPSAGSLNLPGRRVRVAVPLLLLLVAFALRVFRLEVQSFWYDEVFSIDNASHGLGAVFTLSAVDIHPPLHSLLLYFWMPLVGNGEFSLRFLSVFFGLLAIALLYQLGRLLFGPRGAALSLLAAAVAPFLVYYSQETRPYALALFFTVLAAYAALRWQRGREDRRFPASAIRENGESPARAGEGSEWGAARPWLVCYMVASIAATYTHYYAWLIVLFLNLFVLFSLRANLRELGRRAWPWLLAQLLVVLAYAPWVGVLVRKYQTYGAAAAHTSLGDVLYQTLVSFGLGYWAGQAGVVPGQKDIFPDHWIVLSLALLLLAVATLGLLNGLRHPGRRESLRHRTFLGFYVLVPLVAVLAFSWVGKLDFEPRYLLFAAPAYYLLMGRGMASLFTSNRALGCLAIVLVLGATALPLRNYYFDPVYWRDDVRGLARYVQDHAGEDDAVILNTYYFRTGFLYYYKGKAPVVDLPASMPADWSKDLPALEELARSHPRVWLVLWQDYYTDPQHQVQGWLEKQGLRIQHQTFGGFLNVLGYLTRPPVVEAPSGEPVGVQFGGAIELAAFQPPKGPVCAGTETGFTLYWRAVAPVTANYTVFVHLVDEQGRTAAQADSPPANGGYPTTAWPSGALVADERWITIPAGTPPGPYYLEAGMYEPATMKVLGAGGPGPSQQRLGPLQVVSPGGGAGCR